MTDKNELQRILSEIISEVDKSVDLFTDPSVENGKMGLALFYFFCYQFYQDDNYLIKAENMIEESIQLLSRLSQQEQFVPEYKGDSLSNTVSSFGKGLLFVQYKFNYGYDFTEYYEQISEILLDLNQKSFIEKDFDFFSGALSAGHFFLNRYHHEKDETSKNALLEIWHALEKEAIYHSPEEVFWNAPHYMNKVYLGISHGSAMVVNFMTKLFESGILNDNSIEEKQLLQHAVNFMMNRRRNFRDGYFPDIYTENAEHEQTQFAMCYGDLGILFSLHNANSILKNDILEQEVDKMLATSVQRKKDLRYTYNGGLFYGASGIFYVFKEFFKRTDNVIYRDTCEYWYNQVITYRDPQQEGMAGFVDGFKYVENEVNRSAKFSYGWGISGIGICLMSGLDQELPLINETLLIGI